MNETHPDIDTDHGDEPDDLNEHVYEPGDPDGIVAKEEEQRYSRESQPVSPPSATTSASPKRRWLLMLVVIVLVAAVAVIAYWLGSHTASAPVKSSKTSQTAQPAEVVVVPTKHYDSTTYTLGFDYPGNWVVSDTPTKLTVTSPALKMTDLDGATTGHIVVTMQNQQTSIPDYPATGGMANLASEKLTYKQPSSVQRAQTYLSYVAYKSPNGVDAMFLTGDSGYQVGQQVPMADVVKASMLVSVTFETCSSSDCATGTTKPITLLATSWKKAAFNPQVIDLLQSATFN